MEGNAGHVFDPALFAIFREQLPSMLAVRHRSDTQVESFPALPSSGVFSAVKSRRRPRWPSPHHPLAVDRIQRSERSSSSNSTEFAAVTGPGAKSRALPSGRASTPPASWTSTIPAAKSQGMSIFSQNASSEP